MGRGKNALKILYVHKALSTIDAELQLINLKINHPEQFKLSIPTAFKSDLYVIPKSKDLGIIGIAEIVLALFLQGQIVGEDGKPVPEVRLARGFEQLFNLKFGSIYDKVGEVFTRKPYNLTKTLDGYGSRHHRSKPPPLPWLGKMPHRRYRYRNGGYGISPPYARRSVVPYSENGRSRAPGR